MRRTAWDITLETRVRLAASESTEQLAFCAQVDAYEGGDLLKSRSWRLPVLRRLF